MLVLISQRRSIFQHGVPNQRTQGSTDDDLHRTSEQIFQIGNQPAGEPRTGLAGDINQQVDIAFGGFLTPRNRAEDKNIAGSVPGCQAKNLLTLVPQLVYHHLHSDLILPPVARGTMGNMARRWFSRRKIQRLLLSAGAVGIAAYAALQVYDSRTLDSEAARLPALLELRPGSTVADVGAGSGRLTVRMAKQVGPQGHVYSTEIDAGRLVEIRKAAAKAGLANVTVIEGGERETRLPPECCDAVFTRRVYHHFTDPSAMGASLYRSVRTGGMLAIIDFPPRFFLGPWTPKGVPANRGGHGVPRKILVEELTNAGFRLVREVQNWPGFQYCVVFRKPEALTPSSSLAE